jgi:hypothetical protein
VTGGPSGIGLARARLLREEGAHVFIMGRRHGSSTRWSRPSAAMSLRLGLARRDRLDRLVRVALCGSACWTHCSGTSVGAHLVAPFIMTGTWSPPDGRRGPRPLPAASSRHHGRLVTMNQLDSYSADLSPFKELFPQDHGLRVVDTLRADGSPHATVVFTGVILHPLTEQQVVAFVSRGDCRKIGNLYVLDEGRPRCLRELASRRTRPGGRGVDRLVRGLAASALRPLQTR